MGKIAGKIAPKTKDALSAEYERKSVYAPVIAVQITKSEREKGRTRKRERAKDNSCQREGSASEMASSSQTKPTTNEQISRIQIETKANTNKARR